MLRLMASVAAGVLASATAWAPAWAQVESLSVRPETATVVIYRDQPVNTVELMEQSRQSWNRLDLQGLALIVETRTIDLPAGEAVIRFRGVATGIVPQSAVLDGLPAHVVERNTDFDLLSPASLIEKSVGEVVRVVRTNPATGEQVERPAVIRAGAAGTVLEVDGQFEALNCSGLTERIVFDRVPEGLGDQPVLSVRTRAEQAGRHTVTLAYLATGLQWSADYVARLAPDGRTLDLTGWLTLANFGGTGFPNAPVQVVAGTLRKDDDTVPVQVTERYPQGGCWPSGTTTAGSGLEPTRREDRVEYSGPPVMVARAAPAPMAIDEIVVTGARIAEQGELGDYKIYTLPEPTTVAARQTKQVRFLEREGVRYERLYRSRIDGFGDGDGSRPAEIQLRLENQARAGLGVALPGGAVTVMQPDSDGRLLLAGEDRFTDKAIGLPVRLAFGQSPDVRVSTRILNRETREEGDISIHRADFEVQVVNSRGEPVTVELEAEPATQRGFRILRQSRRSRVDDTGRPVWRIAVPANGAETLRISWQITN